MIPNLRRTWRGDRGISRRIPRRQHSLPAGCRHLIPPKNLPTAHGSPNIRKPQYL